MSTVSRTIRLIYCILLPIPLLAQLQLTSPVSRMVFQRDADNRTSVLIAGTAPPAATLIEARFVPLAVGQGTTTAWTAIPLLAGSSAFRGGATVSAGWYRLDVRAKAGTTLLAESHVNRVGVGEVFLVAGQSNAYGGFERVSGAADDRVSCVDFRQDSLSEQLLPLQFSHISYGTNIGPSQPPHLWGMLGDKLVQRLNVPVLFLGAALGGTSSSDWGQSAAGSIGNTPTSSVYRRLGAAVLHYVGRTGLRAVLWHQGESDSFTDPQTYFINCKTVIEKSRQQANFNRLSWMVSRASYINGQTSPPIITAQNRLITDVNDVYPGPATDSIIGASNRPDGIHMKGPGLVKFTNAWNQALSDAFFTNAVPFTPTDESTLITSGYTLPLTRRPGETLVVASLRSDPHEADNQYFVQMLRADTGETVYESPRSTDNPILVTLPANLPDGRYRFRTLSTHPATAGTLGEPFEVRQSAPVTPAPASVLRVPVRGGTADAGLQRLGYRYEEASHGFFAMIQTTASMEIRLERIDGGPFGDSGWHTLSPVSEAPDYTEFADFNFVRNYPPTSFGVGGVEPGRYRLSVRRQGDNGVGIWFELKFLEGRYIVYFPMEPIPPIPPVLTIGNLSPAVPCPGDAVDVFFDITDGSFNSGNNFSIRLSDATGSFASETTIGTGNGSPIRAQLPSTVTPGSNYQLRLVATSPAVASAPGPALTFCAGNTAADLALTMQVSHRIPALNQPVTFTVVLRNDGPADAQQVRLMSRFPDGLTFVDSPSPAISTGPDMLTINAGTLLSGASMPFSFRLKATRPGSFQTAIQVISSSRTDPDSQPGSGTGDGQDDAATVDFRTIDGLGDLTVSPNPGQIPLPPVQSNQPAPDPAKADLSVAITASQVALATNGTISVSLTVSNRGGAAVSSAMVQALLPTGWQLTNSTGFGVSGQLVGAATGAISAGGSATLVLPVRVGATGTLQAQIAGSPVTDPDSTPGNGYQNGEDDAGSLLVRVW